VVDLSSEGKEDWKVVLFSAPGCFGCIAAREALKDTVPIDEINCEEEFARANEAKIMSVPTILVVDDSGEEQARWIGWNSGYTSHILSYFE